MYVNFQPEAFGIDLPLQDLIPFATRNGLEGIDLPLKNIGTGVESMSLREIEDAMAEAGLIFGVFSAPWDYDGERAVYEQRMEELKAWVPIAQRLGCGRAASGVRPCHNKLDYDDNFELHVERLTPMVQLLADHGIRLAMEFIGPKTLRDGMKYEFVHTLPQMLELIAALTPEGGEQCVGVLLDSYHWYTSAGTAEELTGLLDNEKTVVVHINDAVKGRTRDQQMDLERQLPCTTGIIDSAMFVRCIKEIGYDGPVIVEPFDAELNKQPHDDIAQRVVASARQMLELT